MYRYITFGPKTNLAEHETYETLQGTFVIDFLSFKCNRDSTAWSSLYTPVALYLHHDLKGKGTQKQ